MFRLSLGLLIFCISLASFGDVVLTHDGWKKDEAYTTELAPYFHESAVTKTKMQGPAINFNHGDTVTLELADGQLPKLPIDVSITKGPSGSKIDRTSLKVRAKKGVLWKSITDQILGWLEPAECPEDQCNNLALVENFDLSRFGSGNYKFIVDIRDASGLRTIGVKEVNILR